MSPAVMSVRIQYEPTFTYWAWIGGRMVKLREERPAPIMIDARVPRVP